MGLLDSVKNVFKGSLNNRQIKKTEPILEEIKELREEYNDSSYEDFRERVTEMRSELTLSLIHI